MSRIVLTFGLISGAISSLWLIVMVPLVDSIGFESSTVLGYTSFVASFLLVFFGIRAYRERVAGGTLTFGRAVQVGLLITLTSCVCYVITWEVIYFTVAPDFVDRYAAYTIEQLKASGGTPAEIAKTATDMAAFKEMYANPLINAGLTLLEPLPIGLLVTLVSAAALRKQA